MIPLWQMGLIALVGISIIGIYVCDYYIEKDNKQDIGFEVTNEIPQTLWINGSGNICLWTGNHFVCEEIDTGRIYTTDENMVELPPMKLNDVLLGDKE